MRAVSSPWFGIGVCVLGAAQPAIPRRCRRVKWFVDDEWLTEVIDNGEMGSVAATLA